MATKTKTPKATTVRLTARPVCPCELLPNGQAGEVMINDDAYAIEYIGELPATGQPVIHGYRLTKPDNTTYDVPASTDACECWGHMRHGHCKHTSALRHLRQAGEI